MKPRRRWICAGCQLVVLVPAAGHKCPVCGDAMPARDKRRQTKRTNGRRGARMYVVNQRLLELAERDRWCCHLCGAEVPRGPWREDDPLRPTRDHVKPKSAGGGRRGNLRLAHASCNHRRGDAPLDSPPPAK